MRLGPAHTITTLEHDFSSDETPEAGVERFLQRQTAILLSFAEERLRVSLHVADESGGPDPPRLSLGLHTDFAYPALRCLTVRSDGGRPGRPGLGDVAGPRRASTRPPARARAAIAGLPARLRVRAAMPGGCARPPPCARTTGAAAAGIRASSSGAPPASPCCVRCWPSASWRRCGRSRRGRGLAPSGPPAWTPPPGWPADANLNLSYTGLTALPPTIGELTSLRILRLSHNKLTSLPPELGNLAGLEVLAADSNAHRRARCGPL